MEAIGAAGLGSLVFTASVAGEVPSFGLSTVEFYLASASSLVLARSRMLPTGPSLMPMQAPQYETIVEWSVFKHSEVVPTWSETVLTRSAARKCGAICDDYGRSWRYLRRHPLYAPAEFIPGTPRNCRTD